MAEKKRRKKKVLVTDDNNLSATLLVDPYESSADVALSMISTEEVALTPNEWMVSQLAKSELLARVPSQSRKGFQTYLQVQKNLDTAETSGFHIKKAS